MDTLLCKIADLLVEIPEDDGLGARLLDYRTNEIGEPDITLDASRYRPETWPTLSQEDVAYMESGFQFYYRLLRFGGMMLHASAVELDGRAYLFSGPCGVGKSTHTSLWRDVFGEDVVVFNDDKPALRRIDGRWYAYGTPWCGKDGINVNMKVPLAGICFLKQSDHNEIRRLEGKQALSKVISQTTYRLRDADKMMKMMKNVDQLIAEIPIYELFNRPERAAAELSYQVMSGNSPEVSYED